MRGQGVGWTAVARSLRVDSRSGLRAPRPQEAASLSQPNASLFSFLPTSGPRRVPGYSEQKSQLLFHCQRSSEAPLSHHPTPHACRELRSKGWEPTTHFPCPEFPS